MTWFDYLLTDLGMIAACVGLSTAIVGFVAAASLSEIERNRVLVLVFGLAVIGAVAGVAGGSSRVGVVGDVIPAALGLIGGVAVYVFGAQPKNSMIVSFAAAGFALSLGLGYAAAAGKRGQSDAYLRSLARCEAIFTDADVLSSSLAMENAIALFTDTCSDLFGSDYFQTFGNAKGELNKLLRETQSDLKKDMEKQQNLMRSLNLRPATE